jgi:hypothetical protein
MAARERKEEDVFLRSLHCALSELLGLSVILWERGSVSRSSVIVEGAFGISRSPKPALLLRVADPRSLGYGFAALR